MRIKQVEQYKYLGAHFRLTFNWTSHVVQIVDAHESKASSVVELLARICSGGLLLTDTHVTGKVCSATEVAHIIEWEILNCRCVSIE